MRKACTESLTFIRNKSLSTWLLVKEEADNFVVFGAEGQEGRLRLHADKAVILVMSLPDGYFCGAFGIVPSVGRFFCLWEQIDDICPGELFFWFFSTSEGVNDCIASSAKNM